MADAYIGEIRIFGFDFAPRFWAACNGQLLSIQQNAALFSILGTTYGGNGSTTFALPDLRGRTPVHWGQGPGLSAYNLGQVGGSENVTLTSTQLPQHTHVVNASSNTADLSSPDTNFFASGGQAVYNSGAPDAAMSPLAMLPTGGSQPHPNLAPYSVLNFSICLAGIFPSRN